MIVTAEYCRLMARYSMWQNKGLRGIVEEMDPAELKADRGAFFGSIWSTLNHILWADRTWMARFDGGKPPGGSIKKSKDLAPTPAVWAAERFRTDGRILAWAETLTTLDLTGTLSWHSAAAGREITLPAGVCVTHMFNHQTHHRGQVHAMLTAAGITPPPTDLFLMPGAQD